MLFISKKQRKRKKETGLTNHNKRANPKHHMMKHMNNTVNQLKVEGHTWNGAGRQARENAPKSKDLGFALITSWSFRMELFHGREVFDFCNACK